MILALINFDSDSDYIAIWMLILICQANINYCGNCLCSQHLLRTWLCLFLGILSHTQHLSKLDINFGATRIIQEASSGRHQRMELGETSLFLFTYFLPFYHWRTQRLSTLDINLGVICSVQGGRSGQHQRMKLRKVTLLQYMILFTYFLPLYHWYAQRFSTISIDLEIKLMIKW